MIMSYMRMHHRIIVCIVRLLDVRPPRTPGRQRLQDRTVCGNQGSCDFGKPVRCGPGAAPRLVGHRGSSLRCFQGSFCPHESQTSPCGPSGKHRGLARKPSGCVQCRRAKMADDGQRREGILPKGICPSAVLTMSVCVVCTAYARTMVGMHPIVRHTSSLHVNCVVLQPGAVRWQPLRNSCVPSEFEARQLELPLRL